MAQFKLRSQSVTICKELFLKIGESYIVGSWSLFVCFRVLVNKERRYTKKNKFWIKWTTWRMRRLHSFICMK